MLRRTPSLVQQVKMHLKQRIRAAEFADGRFPPEADLARELGVSRNTLRDALSQLEAEGVIFRRQGAGTFVSQAGLMVKTRLEEIIPYETLIRQHGYNPTVKLLSVRQEPVEPEIKAGLEAENLSDLLVIKKLFLAGDTPVIFSITYLPPHLITRPYTPDDIRGPIYRFLPRFCQQEFAYYLTEIVPVDAPPWLADTLQLPSHRTVLLAFDETGYNQDDRPVVRARSYFRHDLIRLRLVRRLAV